MAALESGNELLKAKVNLLKRVNDECVKADVNCFVSGWLAAVIDSGRKLEPMEVWESWSIAIERKDYKALVNCLNKLKLLLLDDMRGNMTLYETERKLHAGEYLKLIIYDVVPAGLEEYKDFEKAVTQNNTDYLQSISNPDTDKVNAYKKLCAAIQALPVRTSSDMIAHLTEKMSHPFNRNLLYPLKNRKFYGKIVRIPLDCTQWKSSPSNDLAEKKLEIILQLDQFCSKKKIPYFAISKLDISARMYADLLPNFGSSAMEVGMLRSDFERFKAEIKKEKNFTSYDTKNGVLNGLLYLTLKQFVVSKKRPSEIIAVLPYDVLPVDERERRDFLAQVKNLNDEYAKLVKNNKKKDAEKKYHEIYALATKYKLEEGKKNYISRICCGKSKVLYYHDAYPVRQVRMQYSTINSPQNPFLWAENTDRSYCEATALKKTEILRRLQSLCAAHSIEIFAIADLLVGFVTYGDYVPNKPTTNWDIACLREHYEKLLTVLRTEAERYKLRLNEYRDKANTCPRATKTIDLNEFLPPSGEIRLIPFDKIPEAYDTQYAFLRRIKFFNTLYKNLSNYIFEGKSKLSERELEHAFARYGEKPLPALYEEIQKLAQTYNNDSETHLYGRIAVEQSKFIPENQLFPLENDRFRDILLYRPHDYSVWTPVIDESLHIQITSIQKADLVLIDKVHEICTKLKIGYFVCGGTMLGYERHGGFIPWDDDIDVAMLRHDYDRFIHEAGALLDDRFFLQTRQTDPDIPYLFSKLRLNNTEYITQYNEHRHFHKGICLDIFPFDYVPNDLKEREKFVEGVLKLSAAHNRVVNNQLPEPIDPIKPRTLKEHYYHIYGMLKRWYFHRLSLVKTQDAYLAEATKFNADAKKLKLTTVASFIPSYTWIKTEDLLPYKDVLFEGHPIKVPKRPDIFLKMQYGDYLQLPPKHNQVAHRLLRWSVDVKADEAKK